jgi:integrase/recombinase XerD
LDIYKYKTKKDSIFRVFFDKKESVVILPTNFIYSRENSSIYSSKSVNHYAKVIKYFCGYLEMKFPITAVDDILCSIDGMFISEYFKLLKDDGLQASTIRNRDAIIKEFMEWLTTEEGGRVREESGYIKNQYKTPPSQRKLPKYLLIDEIIQLIKNLHNESQRCMIHFLFDTGIRVSELPRVQKADIPDLSKYPKDQNYFSITIKGSKGKGGNIKERLTYISRPMVQRINNLHNQFKIYRKAKLKYKNKMPCFLNIHGGEITENAIKAMLRQAAQRGNLLPKKFSAHKYRHSFALSILASEYDPEFTNKMVMTKEALGHNHIKSTEIYTAIAPIAIKNLQKTNKSHEIMFRFELSQKIHDETFKPQKLHTEKRGRRIALNKDFSKTT